MKANNSLRINMPRALELISFFFLGHGPTYPISDLSGSAIMRGNCIKVLEVKTLCFSHLTKIFGIDFDPICRKKHRISKSNSSTKFLIL